MYANTRTSSLRSRERACTWRYACLSRGSVGDREAAFGRLPTRLFFRVRRAQAVSASSSAPRMIQQPTFKERSDARADARPSGGLST